MAISPHYPHYYDIAYFLEVARTMNISRASERLGITQPSLSSAIKRLEHSVGTPLLIRGRTGVQLTKAGQELQEGGRALLLSWEQLRSRANRRESAVSGRYRIGCHPSVALYSLPHFLPQLMQDYPDLEIQLTHDLSRRITEKIISFEIDFGIVVNPVRHPDLVIRLLRTDQVTFWVPKQPSPTQVLDFKKGVVIGDMNLNQVHALLGQLSRKKKGFRRMIQSSNLEVITELTAAGAGVGILPRSVATRQPQQGLRPLGKDLPSFRDEICLVYRSDTQKTKGAQAIANAIRSTVKKRL